METDELEKIKDDFRRELRSLRAKIALLSIASRSNTQEVEGSILSTISDDALAQIDRLQNSSNILGII